MSLRRASRAGAVVALLASLAFLVPTAAASAQTRPVSAVPMAAATAIRAGTPALDARAGLLSRINAARAALGLQALRLDLALSDLATKRAAFMVSTGVLSHTTWGGTIGDAMATTGITWYSIGEDVARSSAATGADTAAVLFEIWRTSPPHWAQITSATFNYIGIGVAFTSAGAPFGSLFFAETPDRTAPVAAMTAATVSGATVTFRWKGTEIALQTHTAGLCSFDAQYRVDAGLWRTLRSATRLTSTTLTGRPRGHLYSVRIRARDCAGNVSAWTSSRGVRVP